jgi:prophage regulatory protein
MPAPSVVTRRRREQEPASFAKPTLPPSQFLSLSRLPQLQARVHLSRSAIYSLMDRDPTFPRPITMGRSIAWIDNEIDEWIKSRMANRAAA